MSKPTVCNHFTGIAGSPVSDSVSEHVSDADYQLDPCLPPFGSVHDAQTAARSASELDQLAKKCSDPIKASMIKTCADALWQSSIDTYSFVFRQRGYL